MRYALILAGGSGVRLWPMSRTNQPKQLIPFIAGRSLLQIAADRLQGLVAPENCYICAAESQREMILAGLPGWPAERFLGEPVGRDTLNAVAFSAEVIAKQDPEAAIAVFTADHLIEPVEEFQRIVESAFELVLTHPNMLVTFGIEPTHPATGYGYLELGEPISGAARRVCCFREKPDVETAREWVAHGPRHFLWNSGMFVWRAATLLECVRRYQPGISAALSGVGAAWGTPQQSAVLNAVYPTLEKISVDYAVMEPASHDAAVEVAAVPMPLHWIDVGSWPMFAKTCPADENGNSVAAARAAFLRSSNNVVASSDPSHLVALVGCEGLVVIHTPDATLVCTAEQAESIKQLHQSLGERFGPEFL